MHLQPMKIALDFLMLGFSSPNTFTLRNMPPTPVILRGAEGEVAESIIQRITLALRERGDRQRRWVRVVGEHLPNHSARAGCGVMIEDFF